MLTVFVPKEKNDKRVAATPSTVALLKKLHLNIVIEKGAGLQAAFQDKEYEKSGAKITTFSDGIKQADILFSIHPLEKKDVAKLKTESVTLSFLDAFDHPESIDAYKKASVSSFSFTFLPRISRAQKMDALSSQSNLAGYKAVLLAASHLQKIFPLMMTASGTLKPARVVVLGAGVAGLSAIATAKRLGAIVEASDVRPAAKEQVESLGATFIDVEFDNDAETKGGYAKQASKDFLKKQAAEVDKRLKQADVVVTTALVAGKKAPTLITEQQVKAMKHGSVIVDLAAIAGGNCALTKKGKVTETNGVTIVAHENVPELLATDASEMYAMNCYHFIKDMIKEGKLHIDFDDEVYDQSNITHKGEIRHPVINGGAKNA